MSFAFLAHPPPQKQRPLYSPPSIPQQPAQPVAPTTPTSPRPANRPRSSTTSAIAAWVAQIQPGTPTLSPHRQASFSRRPSVTGSFLSLIDTPTTAASAARTPGSLRDFKGSLLDLTTQGYTSVFVQLPVPKTPDSPPAPNRSHIIPLNIPIPPIPTSPTRGPKKTKSLSRLRSLSFKSAAAMLAPKKHKDDTAKASSSSKSKSSDASNSNGKARYGHIVRPMTLANEVQLLQLLDGGSVNSNVKRVMEAQARAAGMQPGAIGGGVSDAYRDGRGGLWRDQDEEWEFATLIDAKGRGAQPRQRHQQPQPSPKGLPGKLKTLGLGKSTNKSAAPSSPKGNEEWVDFSDDEDEERRGSLSSSLSSAVDAYDDLTAFGGALGGGPRRPGSSVLNAPKSHRAKPVFSQDPFAPKAPASTSSRGTGTTSTSSRKEGETERKKGSARRRPEPITLPPPSPRSSSQRPSNSPVPAAAAVDARRAFLDSSFAPDASVAASSSRSSGAPSMEAVALAVTSRGGRGPPSPEVMRSAGARMVKTKRSRMDMRGMIRGLKRD
ncbi:hypothetical protein BD410DRAFT_529546 [Rickenella mellea]|uniref:Uncharacterized protein n=1 Tax=Rickenella mellea TaxID=50990 RepID=A0A4Y7QG42_9AGAM|nr:hypothetical protein BD410DRAFT_529546 [Rickenella mellea]